MPSRRQGVPDELEPAMRPERGGLGREQVGREQVSDIQRARILAAMADVASELGAGNATVARVVARSGVSRRTYYELFADREGCFLAAFDQAVARACAVVTPAFEERGPWRAKVRAALTALLEFLDREQTMGRVLIVESLGAGPKALERRQNVLLQILPIVEQGQGEGKRDGAPPPLTAEGIVGGVLSLIHTRMLASSPLPATRSPRTGDPEGDSLLGLLNPLMAMVVLPYLGAAAARRELAQPLPPAPNGARTTSADPLRQLDMRLTYRTVRVLLAIGDLSGRGSHPSNDQGQVSKLLARLQQLGLIENALDARAKGEPNKWRLTQRGGEVREVISP
jgi:AcrR family transcriptional regulator